MECSFCRQGIPHVCELKKKDPSLVIYINEGRPGVRASYEVSDSQSDDRSWDADVVLDVQGDKVYIVKDRHRSGQVMARRIDRPAGWQEVKPKVGYGWHWVRIRWAKGGDDPAGEVIPGLPYRNEDGVIEYFDTQLGKAYVPIHGLFPSEFAWYVTEVISEIPYPEGK